MSQTPIRLQLKEEQREWGTAESAIRVFFKLMMFGMGDEGSAGYCMRLKPQEASKYS